MTAYAKILAVLALTTGAAATASADPVVTVLHNFSVADGDVAGSSVPVSVILLAGQDGAVYGTRDLGDRAGGSVFRLTPPIAPAASWTYTTIYQFASTVRPNGPILQDLSGQLFGTTATTPPVSSTSFYRLQRPVQGGNGWVQTPLYSLSGRTGFVDALDAMGRLYCEGETPAGSANESELTIFQLFPPSAGGTAYTSRTLFSRAGLQTSTPLLLRYRPAGAIDLYGLANATSNNLPSLAFKLSSPVQYNGPWTFTTLHQFHQFDLGGYLPASLSADRSLNLYGFNYGGGSANNGFLEGGVFRIEPLQGAQSAWTERSLYQFQYGTIIDGYCSGAAFSCGNSISGVIEGPNGVLYVSSRDSHAGDHDGAIQGPGVIFSLTPVSAGGNTTPWDVKVQHQFTTTDPAGQGPGAFVRTVDAGGHVSFVGVTGSGGTHGLGTIFLFTP